MWYRTYERMILIAKLSVVLNAAMAIGKLALGIYSASLFMVVNALYSVGIGAAKMIAIKGYSLDERLSGTSDAAGMRKKEYRHYRWVGLILLCSSVAYAIYCTRLFFGGSTMQYDMIVGIAIAAFTFLELGMAIHGVLTMRRNREPIFEALKLITLASALITLVLTQAALTSFAGVGETGEAMDMSFFNGLSGLVFGGLAALIGLYMVVRVRRADTNAHIASMRKKTSRILKKCGIDEGLLQIEITDDGPGATIMRIEADGGFDANHIEAMKELQNRLDVDKVYARTSIGG